MIESNSISNRNLTLKKVKDDRLNSVVTTISIKNPIELIKIFSNQDTLLLNYYTSNKFRLAVRRLVDILIDLMVRKDLVILDLKHMNIKSLDFNSDVNWFITIKENGVENKLEYLIEGKYRFNKLFTIEFRKQYNKIKKVQDEKDINVGFMFRCCFSS